MISIEGTNANRKAVRAKQYQNALNFVKMSSDSEPEQNSSGSESFTDFEEEIEGLVDAAVIDDKAEIPDIDRPYMGEPLANKNWLRDYNSRREEEKHQNEVLLRRLDGTFSVESW